MGVKGIFIIVLLTALFSITLAFQVFGMSEEEITEKKNEIFGAKDKYITVGAEGCEFKSIKEALVAVNNERSTIWIMDRIHTEYNIELDKNVIIKGFGMDKTFIQAAGKPTDAQGRVFLVKNGISAQLEDLTIRNGKVDKVPRCGAGVFNQGDLLIVRVAVRENLATYGVGIENEGSLNIRDSVIAGNRGIKRPPEDERNGVDCGGSGAGLKVENGEAFISGCLITENMAVVNGGGIHVSCDGKVELTNCTIIGNVADFQGGGISVRGYLNLVHCTVTKNKGYEGSGILAMGKVDMKGTIVAGNEGRDFMVGSGYGEEIINTNVYNLIGDGKVDSFLSGDAMLDTLADNGGPTKTSALDKKSPAVNAIPENKRFVNVDQRGMPRTSSSDIGAYELQTEQDGAKLSKLSWIIIAMLAAFLVLVIYYLKRRIRL